MYAHLKNLAKEITKYFQTTLVVAAALLAGLIQKGFVYSANSPTIRRVKWKYR